MDTIEDRQTRALEGALLCFAIAGAAALLSTEGGSTGAGPVQPQAAAGSAVLQARLDALWSEKAGHGDLAAR